MTGRGAATRAANGAQRGELADARVSRAGAKARMLLVVNPKATTVSDRLKNLISYALKSRYSVHPVETEAQNHATELTRAALDEAYDLVVAFGGDGTVNEVANGLAGSEVPLAVLPGGCTNVVARTLGMPPDIVDATEHLLALADSLPVRRIDLAFANDRCFVSSAGLGLDADTARWVDQHAPLKWRAGPVFFTYAALMSFYGKYAGRPPRLLVDAGGQPIEGVTAVVQNSDPFTYFRSQPIRVCEGAALDNGTLSATVLRSARQRDVPPLAWKLLTGRGRVSDHSQIASLTGSSYVRVTALERDGRPLPFPVQVDGDYIGHHTDVSFKVQPGALRVLA